MGCEAEVEIHSDGFSSRALAEAVRDQLALKLDASSGTGGVEPTEKGFGMTAKYSCSGPETCIYEKLESMGILKKVKFSKTCEKDHSRTSPLT